MKKLLKGLIKATAVPAALTGMLALFNKAIYLNAIKNSDTPTENQTYRWKYSNVNYEKTGNGQPLMLIHSLYTGSSLNEWKKAAEILSKYYTVYNIDLPGYGHSDKPKMSYAAFVYAAFLNDFAKDVIKKPVYMIAANGSSNSAVMSAKNYETIEKLMIISPQTFETFVVKKLNKFKRFLIELPIFGTAFYNIYSTRYAIKKNITEYGFFAKENIDSNFIDECYRASHIEKGSERYAFAALLTDYMDMDVRNIMSSLEIPCAVCWGEENTKNPIKNMEMLETIVPDAQYLIFEKTKAYPHIENASEFVNAAHNFFK